MGRKADGQVIERRWKAGRGYALRFLAYGERHYLTLGLKREGWSSERAEEELPLPPLMRDELAAHKAASPNAGPDDAVFPTATGRARDKDNIRNRVLEPIAKRADELLAERGHPPLPKGLTPHKLRHTFASVLVACGEDPASVIAQLGHTDPKLTLRVYAHVMRRDPPQRARLRALVDGEPQMVNRGDRRRRLRPQPRG